jgi:hypothetical protein
VVLVRRERQVADNQDRREKNADAERLQMVTRVDQPAHDIGQHLTGIEE